MKQILIFNSNFFSKSETFIYRQISLLQKHFKISLLAAGFKDQANFPLVVSGSFLINKPGFFERQVNKLVKRLSPYFLRNSPFFNHKVNRLLRHENIDIIHAHYGWNGIRILPFAKKRRIPLVISFHGRDASATVREKAYKNCLPGLFDYASAIVVCAEYMVHALGLQPWIDKVHVIPYGVNQEEFNRFTETAEPGRLRILHAGRLVPKKGVPDLIRVFERVVHLYPETELHIIGDGQDMEMCKKIAEAQSLKKAVHFYGEQPISFVKKIMAQADIFVLNSRRDQDGDMEGLPNAILEAMSFKTAVIATNHAGIPMAIKHMENGILVPEKNNQALYDALITLIAAKDLRIVLGEKARNTILQSFTETQMEARLTRLFCNVQGSKS